jgi:hypothetical protein
MGTQPENDKLLQNPCYDVVVHSKDTVEENILKF